MAVFLIFIWCVRVVAGWGLSRLPIGKPPADGAPPDDEGSGKEPVGFWLRLALDLNLLALSVPVFLLIVGFDWLDVRRWIGLLAADIRIGAISFSFTDILSAVGVFLLVSMGTRWVTGIVDRKLLQRTSLDPGERNSITTLVNYVGVTIAILMALAIEHTERPGVEPVVSARGFSTVSRPTDVIEGSGRSPCDDRASR